MNLTCKAILNNAICCKPDQNQMETKEVTDAYLYHRKREVEGNHFRLHEPIVCYIV